MSERRSAGEAVESVWMPVRESCMSRLAKPTLAAGGEDDGDGGGALPRPLRSPTAEAGRAGRAGRRTGRRVGRQVGRYVTVVRCPWRSLCVPLAWLDTPTACLAGALHWLRHVTAFTLQTPASSPARSAV